MPRNGGSNNNPQEVSKPSKKQHRRSRTPEKATTVASNEEQGKLSKSCKYLVLKKPSEQPENRQLDTKETEAQKIKEVESENVVCKSDQATTSGVRCTRTEISLTRSISDSQMGRLIDDRDKPVTDKSEKSDGQSKDISSDGEKDDNNPQVGDFSSTRAKERNKPQKEKSALGDKVFEEATEVRRSSQRSRKGRKVKKGPKKPNPEESGDIKDLPEFIIPPEFAGSPKEDDKESEPYKAVTKACDKCGMVFFNLGSYRSHWYREKGYFTSNNCKTCHASFLRICDLQFHELNAHRTLKEFTCHFGACARKYDKIRDLAIHMRSSHKDHRIADCDKCYYWSGY